MLLKHSVQNVMCVQCDPGNLAQGFVDLDLGCSIFSALITVYLSRSELMGCLKLGNVLIFSPDS